jgi:3-hydroxyisobutyrate dehydrogenase-like beta-hydroxyacid dehydrogenase
MAERIGFIGLGTMGSRLVKNLAEAGLDVTVYDRRTEVAKGMEKLGVRSVGSVAELANQVDIIEIAVAPQPEVENVILGPGGILESAPAGLIIDNHSEVFPADIRRIAAEAERRGVHLLDAQMSGGGRGVEKHSLCFMVGGDPTILERCRPIMRVSSDAIFHLGPVGTGAAAKIIQNTILSGILVATAEGFALAKASNIDPEVFQGVVQTSACQSHVGDDWLTNWGRQVRPDAYQWILASALRIADEAGIKLPGVSLTKEVLPILLGPRPIP